MSTLFESLGIAEFPASTASQSVEQEPTRSGMRAVADFGVNIGKGAVSGVRMLADTFGADNEVSGGLRTIEDAIGEFASAKSKRDQQRMGEIMAEAEGKGWGAELSAALKAAGAAPDALIGQAIGTMVPTVAASMIPGALPARLAAAGVGGAMGVGSAKGGIYEAEQKHWLDRGATAEEAKFLATEAQNYDGANAANIAISGGLGVLAGTSGAEKLARGLVRGASGDVVDGLGKRVLKGSLAEAAPEGAQGGFEKYTTNSALVNDGADIDPMAGVVGNAALEAAVSVPVGGALSIPKPAGPLSRGANVATEAAVSNTPDDETLDVAVDAEQRRKAAQALAAAEADKTGVPVVRPVEAVDAAGTDEATARGATAQALAAAGILDRRDALGVDVPVRQTIPVDGTLGSLPTGDRQLAVQQGELAAQEPIDLEPIGQDGPRVGTPRRIGERVTLDVDAREVTDPAVGMTPRMNGPSNGNGGNGGAGATALEGDYLLDAKGRPIKALGVAVNVAKKRGIDPASIVKADGGFMVPKPQAPTVNRSQLPAPGWAAFPQETGTLGVPREEMPQVKTEHRGAMVNYLNARGVGHEAVEVDAATLKPTQAEFSPEKVEKAKESDGKRSILISSDGHIIDGHHQAIAHAEKGEPVKAIRLDAPAVELIPMVNEFPSSTKDATSAEAQSVAQAGKGVVLQNRDRTTAASIAQMNDIAAKPDYLRAGPSRDMTTGAPVVFGDMPKGAAMGRTETIVDGKGQRVQASYAVIEASDLIASNQADGTPVTEYTNGMPGKMRSIAGNGRTAGLKAAYGRDTAVLYRQELEGDAASHGVDAAAIKKMSQPVLVRVMRSEDVTPDMGDRTNISGTQALSPVEQASNDARRVDLTAMDFKPNGDPSDEAVRGFVKSMPVSEQGSLMNKDGTPTRQAVDRFMAATFKQAYGSDELVHLYAQATDPEARAVMSALADAAGAMASLSDAGDMDIRKAVAGAAKMAVNAARSGKKLSEVVQNSDLDFDPEAFVVAQFMAENIRSSKAMGDGLRNWAAFANQQAQIARDNQNQSGIFGDQPTIDRDQLFQTINSPEPNEVSRRPRDAARRAERQEADTGAGETGTAGRTDSQEESQWELTSQTPADIEAKQAREEAAQRKLEADERAATQQAVQDEDRKRIAQASVRAADSFELGQDPMDSLTGQRSVFDAEPDSEPKDADDTIKLTQAEARELMEWQNMGQADGVKKHTLFFYETKADKDAKRGRMAVATVTKGDRTDKAWMVDGDDQKFGSLADAKREGVAIGMAKAVSDGFVSEDPVKGQSKSTYTYTPGNKIETQAQSALANARQHKAAAFERLKRARANKANGRVARLELLQAEDVHKEALRAEANALAQLEEEANRLGLTTIKSKVNPTEQLAEPVGASSSSHDAAGDAGNVAMFSRGSNTSVTTQQQAQKVVDGIKARWSNAPEVVVVSDMQDSSVPKAVRDYDASQRSLGAKGEPEGFWYGGKAYIVAGSLNSDADVARVLFHEVLGHYGLRGVFGDALAPILRQISVLRRNEVEAKAKAYGLDMNDEAQRMHAAEEVLAEMAQSTPEIGYVKRAIAAIRAFLRKHVPGFAVMKLSDAEIIQQYILPSRAFVERGGPNGGPGGGISFSRSPGGATAATSGAAGWRDLSIGAGYKVNDFIGVHGSLNWWHKSVGTMYNLAQRHDGFKAVFEAVQRFIGDASYYAAEAAAHAPTVLPKLDKWRDIGKSPLSAADTEALSRPIFEGTLNYGRTVTGALYKAGDLKRALADKTAIEQADLLKSMGIMSDADVDKMKVLPEDEFKAALSAAFEEKTMQVGTVFTGAELASEFGLNAKQVGLYKEVRTAIDKSLENLAISHMLKVAGKEISAAERDEIMALGLADATKKITDLLATKASESPSRMEAFGKMAQAVEKTFAQVQKLVMNGYAPLSRFGDYTLEAKTADGEYHFSMHDSASDRNKAARLLTQEGATITGQGTMSKEAFKLLNSISPESLALFGEILELDGEGSSDSDIAYQAFLQKAIANQSAVKRMIHRKGTAGYSEDIGRVLAGFVYSNGRLTSSNLHKKSASDAANKISKSDGEAKDAAVQLIDYVQNPREEAQAFRAFLFAQYLGGSVASAVMNATQPLTMTLPYLSQFGGALKAGKALTSAMEYANGKATGNAALDKALRHAEEEGIVSPQEVHQLLDQSMGKSQLKASNWTTAEGLAGKASNTSSKVAFAWGKVFGIAEQFNRRITFIAAYNMAVERGIANPTEFAKKAVNETQGIYNKGNKPKWARGGVGSTLFTFKQFTIGYVEWLVRMGTQGEAGSPERKAGQKAVAVALGVLFLTAGIGGLPGADDLDDIVDGVMQRAGYNFSAKQAKREFLTDLIGPAGAAFAIGGITAIPGSPVDLSSRFGLGNIVPGTGMFTLKNDYQRDIMEILGPGGDFASRVLSGANKLSKGEVVGAVRDVIPRAAANMVKGAEMGQKDMYLGADGKNVTAVDLGDSALKFFGFQPKIVKDTQDSTREEIRSVTYFRQVKSEIQEQIAKAKFDNDTGEERRVRERVADWNKKNPGQRITINMPSVLRRVRNMRMSKAERTIANTPKAQRAEVAARIRESS